MVLFAGAGICLWVMVFWSVCLTPAAQSRAKVLNICADNAGGGSMVIVRRWKSGGEWTHPAAQHADWTSGKRHRDTARLSNGRRAFDRLLRGPPERGPQRRVTRLSPAFPSPDTVGGYISVNNRNITGQRPVYKIWDARDKDNPGKEAPGGHTEASPPHNNILCQTAYCLRRSRPAGASSPSQVCHVRSKKG